MENENYAHALELASRGGELQEVMSLLQVAHDMGDARATYALGTWYLFGQEGCVGKDVPKAIQYFKESAAKNHAPALFDLAVSHEIGNGVRKNLRRACLLYMAAALQGDAQAHFEVGRMLHHGLGLKKDRAMARIWFDKAKEMGVGE